MKKGILFTRAAISMEKLYGSVADAGSNEMPNGLCYLAAVTREKGYPTVIIDAHAMAMPRKKLVDEIIKLNPGYVGIMTFTITVLNDAEFAKELKKRAPQIKIIAGGPHITAAPEETMKRIPEFDIGVLAEGEETIVDLLEHLEKKKSLSDVNGIIYKKGGKIVKTKPRAFIKNLDRLPLPAWDLLPDLTEYYKAPAWSIYQDKTSLIITSRGCFGQCIFCDRSCFGRAVRFHSAEYVMKMIRELYYKHGIKQFRINDDNFVLHTKRLKDICNAIIKENLKIRWSCFARADSIDKEKLDLMKKSGCWQISYGVESGSQRILDLEKKHMKLETIAKAIKLTKKARIKTVGFNIIGHPTETVEDIKKTIRFNKKSGIEDAKFLFMIPYPNTELYENAKKYGKLVAKDWDEFRDYIPSFIPYGLTNKEMIKWRNRATLYFYLQPRIILAYLLSIRSLSQFKPILKGALAVFKMVLFSKQKK